MSGVPDDDGQEVILGCPACGQKATVPSRSIIVETGPDGVAVCFTCSRCHLDGAVEATPAVLAHLCRFGRGINYTWTLPIPEFHAVRRPGKAFTDEDVDDLDTAFELLAEREPCAWREMLAPPTTPLPRRHPGTSRDIP